MIKVETISANTEIIIPNFRDSTIITMISAYAIELPRISIAKSRKFRERERERERLTASDASGEISFVALARWIMQQRVRNTEDDLRVHGHGNSATGIPPRERVLKSEALHRLVHCMLAKFIPLSGMNQSWRFGRNSFGYLALCFLQKEWLIFFNWLFTVDWATIR